MVVVVTLASLWGAEKDITSDMACILRDYYSTSGEANFLFIPMYRCKPLSVNELILSLNLLLTAHGKFLLTNAYLQHLEFFLFIQTENCSHTTDLQSELEHKKGLLESEVKWQPPDNGAVTFRQATDSGN